jgi:DNA-nicking Smr family endonuclease
MDFGKILDEWDRQRSRRVSEEGPRSDEEDGGAAARGTPNSRAAAAPRCEPEAQAADRKARGAEPDGTAYLKRWLLRNSVPDPDERESGADEEEAPAGGPASAERIKRMRPQAALDLHGKTRAEAELAIGRFLNEAQRRGLEKVLIIHGKGIHSESEPVLASGVRKILEESPMVGAFGPAARESGGRGATWARIRRGDYFSR